MSITLPPPLSEAPPPRPAWQDFRLLVLAQLRVTWNKVRHWPLLTKISIAALGMAVLALLAYLGVLAYGALETMPPLVARGFLSLLFMAGLAGLTFFGITAAFATLYMSEDLELLFMAPIPTRMVFAVKSLVVTAGNAVTAVIFVFIPGLFFGLLLGAGPLFYLWVLLVSLGLLAIGTALAELINLLVMRIVPPHRSREAVGVIGGVAGIMIALLFQVPNWIISRGEQLDIGSLLAGQEQLLQVMDYFPWGWGSLALAGGASGNHLAGLGWSLLLLALGAALFAAAFVLVERGFRRGWISLSQGEGGRRKKRRSSSRSSRVAHQQGQPALFTFDAGFTGSGSAWRGMWSVAKKDLLYMKRDTREWFGYMVPLIIMVFFVAQFLFFSVSTAQGSMISVLIMYTIMFSGNIALQSFGREGESEWFLNSVPLAGWPVVWGKLLGAVLPTLILMELLLTGTALLIGLQPTLVVALAVGAIFISLGASAIGLNFSIRNCRYNPESPQQRIAPGASILMYLINLVFIIMTAFGLIFIFPPAELLALLPELPPLSFTWGFPDTLLYLLYLLSKPLLWPPLPRALFGVIVTIGIWTSVFFNFMAATVRQSRKGFRVEIITTTKKKKL